MISMDSKVSSMEYSFKRGLSVSPEQSLNGPIDGAVARFKLTRPIRIKALGCHHLAVSRSRMRCGEHYINAV